MVRGKSDRIDAKRIAAYACKNREQLKFWSPQRQAVQKLKALLVVRERLVKAKVQIQTPLNESHEFIEGSICKTMAKCCQKTLKALSEDIDKIEHEIDVLLAQDQNLSEQMKYATSVTGIGKITAANVIVSTGEFKRIAEPKKFACYSGIAPFEHTSGSSIRGRARVSKMANMTIKSFCISRLWPLSALTSNLESFIPEKLKKEKTK